MMSSFLARSFRRTLHAQLEDNIIKNLSAGQNLEYDWTWDDLRDSGSIIEEDISDNENTGEEKALEPQSFDEKHALAEEFAAQLSPTKLVVSGLNEAIGTGRRNTSGQLRS